MKLDTRYICSTKYFLRLLPFFTVSFFALEAIVESKYYTWRYFWCVCKFRNPNFKSLMKMIYSQDFSNLQRLKYFFMDSMMFLLQLKNYETDPNSAKIGQSNHCWFTCFVQVANMKLFLILFRTGRTISGSQLVQNTQLNKESVVKVWLNTQYMTNSILVYLVKTEYVFKINICGLKVIFF